MVSFVIPAHNEEAVIGRCLTALLAGARRDELDIIVVCNGCTDRTAEVARCIWDNLHPHGVAVVIEAQHGCMTWRGVRTPGVGMVTSRLLGCFLDDERSRKEVLSLMGY